MVRKTPAENMDSLGFILVIITAQCMVDASATRIPLEVTGTVDIGYWGPEQHCEEGIFANAFQIKVEKDSGRHDKDDTGVNAVKLQCSDGMNITSEEGSNGKYKGLKSCESGYLNYFRLKALLPQSNYQDKLGATNLRMRCTDSSKTLNGGGIRDGTFLEKKECPKGWAISGIQTRIDGWSGNTDLRGLTDVRFWCTEIRQVTEAEKITTQQSTTISSTGTTTAAEKITTQQSTTISSTAEKNTTQHSTTISSTVTTTEAEKNTTQLSTTISSTVTTTADKEITTPNSTMISSTTTTATAPIGEIDTSNISRKGQGEREPRMDGAEDQKGEAKSGTGGGASNQTIIIISCSAAVLLIVVIIGLIFQRRRKINDNQQSEVDTGNHPFTTPADINRHDSENSLYGTYTDERKTTAAADRGSKHDSENSLYESFSVDGAAAPPVNRGNRHDSENSLYGTTGV